MIWLLTAIGACIALAPNPDPDPDVLGLPPPPTPRPPGEPPASGPRPADSLPLLLGTYAPEYLGSTDAMRDELQRWDKSVPQRLSLAGFFFGLDSSNPAYNIPNIAGHLVRGGYTPLMNLSANDTLEELVRGDRDDDVAAIAAATAQWAAEYPDAVMFVGPLQEMNGAWEDYYGEPEDYKAFYARVQEIYADNGVPDDAIQWLFAPNGWSEDGDEFERYYPGHDRIDAVGVSSYLWGDCRGHDWTPPGEVFPEYLDRLAAMAPGKSILLTQTAVSSERADGSADVDGKDDQLRAAYELLAARGDITGVMYFNIDKECDWAVWRDGEVTQGYRDGVSAPGIGYVDPAALAEALRPWR